MPDDDLGRLESAERGRNVLHWLREISMLTANHMWTKKFADADCENDTQECTGRGIASIARGDGSLIRYVFVCPNDTGRIRKFAAVKEGSP